MIEKANDNNIQAVVELVRRNTASADCGLVVAISTTEGVSDELAIAGTVIVNWVACAGM